ncbi:MAG: urease accessory protein UreD [Oscillospiraceae bacterium]|nr:urease accessory protein UreD [Oscillospiraceae bacterium]
MGELFVRTQRQANGRTIVANSYFSNPLKIAKSFYHEDGYTEVMTLLAGPGMLKGDRYNISFEMGENTRTLITAQSYQKLYNSTDGETVQKVAIQVGENAELCYMPQPAIPFTNNTFRSNMEIKLALSAKFIFTDILACGREGMGERLKFARYSSRVCVNVDGKPVFLDHTRLFTGQADFFGLGFYEGRVCQGLIYLYGYDNITLPVYDGVEAAISQAGGGHVVRLLSESPDAAHQFSRLLWESVRTPKTGRTSA